MDESSKPCEIEDLAGELTKAMRRPTCAASVFNAVFGAGGGNPLVDERKKMMEEYAEDLLRIPGNGGQNDGKRKDMFLLD